MTTNGALLWETGTTMARVRIVISDVSQMPANLGIFQLRVLGVAQRMVGNITMVEGVNSTATVRSVQLANDSVTLCCRDTITLTGVHAVLKVIGEFCWLKQLV